MYQFMRQRMIDLFLGRHMVAAHDDLQDRWHRSGILPTNIQFAPDKDVLHHNSCARTGLAPGRKRMPHAPLMTNIGQQCFGCRLTPSGKRKPPTTASGQDSMRMKFSPVVQPTWTQIPRQSECLLMHGFGFGKESGWLSHLLSQPASHL